MGVPLFSFFFFLSLQKTKERLDSFGVLRCVREGPMIIESFRKHTL